MSRLLLQFHADPDELFTVLLPRWLGELSDLNFVVEMGDLADNITHRVVPSLPASPARLLVGLKEFKSLDSNYLDFREANAGSLVVEPGTIQDSTLRESMIGATVGTQAQRARWQPVIRRARRELKRGAVIVNPFGERFEVPGHLYSEGALRLAASGVSMLPVGGTNHYELGRRG